MPSRASVSVASRLELAVEVGERRRIERVLVRDAGRDVIGAPVDREQAERREVARVERDDARLHAEELHHRRRLRRARAAEREQRESARVDAALDRHLADAVRLVPVRDLDDAFGELLDAHAAAEALAEIGDALPRALGVELDAAADQRRRDPPEHEVGVGDRRLVASVRIAHRPRHRAGALRPDLEMALAADPGDRAAAGADGLDVDHRDAHRERSDRAAVGDLRHARLDQAQVGGGATSVQRNQILEAGDLRDHRGAERACRRPGQRGGDRLVHDLLARDHAARGLHHQERLRSQVRPEFVVDALQVAPHVRLHERVDERRHRALVLAVLGQHVARERHRALRVFFAEELAHAALVTVARIRVDEANADGADAPLAEEARREPGAPLVERRELRTAEVEPAADLAHELDRDDALGLHPEVRVAVALGHRLARDLEEVPEACGDDEAERVDLALQQRVGRDRRAVRQAGEVRRRAPGLAEDAGDALDEPDRGVRRRARDLRDRDPARRAVHRDDVGERAAGVDADAEALGGCGSAHGERRI